MAMLERFRKPGGFIQLVALIETCPPLKQEKLLDTVASEDRVWAELVRLKMLSIERILGWDDESLTLIFGTLQDLTVAVAISAAAEPLKTRLHSFVSHGRRRKIDDTYADKVPTDGEVSATHTKIIERVRKMGIDGEIRFEKCDPALAIEDNIDDQLARPSGPDSKPKLVHSYSPIAILQAAGATPKSEPPESLSAEAPALRKRVEELRKENAILRHELAVAKSKLDQIKKIA